MAEVAGDRRVVHRLDRLHPADAIEQHLDGDGGFEPCERRARAHVRACPEGQVRARLRPVEPKRLGILVFGFVAIGGAMPSRPSPCECTPRPHFVGTSRRSVAQESWARLPMKLVTIARFARRFLIARDPKQSLDEMVNTRGVGAADMK